MSEDLSRDEVSTQRSTANGLITERQVLSPEPGEILETGSTAHSTPSTARKSSLDSSIWARQDSARTSLSSLSGLGSGAGRLPAGPDRTDLAACVDTSHGSGVPSSHDRGVTASSQTSVQWRPQMRPAGIHIQSGLGNNWFR